MRCAKVATRSPHEGAEREWCPQHCPEGAVKDIPRCAGKLRNGVGCPTTPIFIAVWQGEEVTLCSVHMGVFNDSDGKSVQTPPKQKKKPMTRIAQPSEPVPDDLVDQNGDVVVPAQVAPQGVAARAARDLDGGALQRDPRRPGEHDQERHQATDDRLPLLWSPLLGPDPRPRRCGRRRQHAAREGGPHRADRRGGDRPPRQRPARGATGRSRPAT